jgi:hypothetical protein
MADALFTPDGSTYVPDEVARGPWAPDALHGGPVAGLLARAVEQHDPSDSVVVRLSVELLRPVPTAPLTVTTRTLRPGKKVQLLEASIAAGGAEVARAVGLRIRRTQLALPSLAQANEPVPPFPTEDDAERRGSFIGWTAFGDGIEMRSQPGAELGTIGPKTVWFRLRQPLVAGEQPSPLVRVACAADFGNGVSAALPWDGWMFINPDLTIHLHREPAGEWIGLDAKTNLDPTGVGMAESRLFDHHGPIGRAVQSLLVDRR